MALAKPPGIESDAFKSAKWDELTAGRDFAQSAALAVWADSMGAAMEALEPARVLLYGGNVGFDFGAGIYSASRKGIGRIARCLLFLMVPATGIEPATH